MKNLISHTITTLCLLGTVIACGKGNKSQQDERLEYRSAYMVPEMQVGHPREVRQTLQWAIRCHRLYDFQKTKWFLYDGRYVFTSYVLSERAYRLQE